MLAFFVDAASLGAGLACFGTGLASVAQQRWEFRNRPTGEGGSVSLGYGKSGLHTDVFGKLPYKEYSTSKTRMQK